MRTHRSVHNSSSEYTVTPRVGMNLSIYLSVCIHMYLERKRQGQSTHIPPSPSPHRCGKKEVRDVGVGMGAEVHCVVYTVAETMNKQ